MQLLTSRNDSPSISSSLQASSDGDLTALYDLVLDHVFSCDVCMDSVVDLRAPASAAAEKCPQLNELLSRDLLVQRVSEAELLNCLSGVVRPNCA